MTETGPRIDPATTTVSVVVAAYGRPQVLRVALLSALAQSRPPLEIVVVGDACDDRVGEVAGSLGGPIRYLNLPRRCGEQAIPNSVGSAMARGDLVAYLNHDDVWLPGHLEASVRSLAAAGRRWHIGAAAYAARPDGPDAGTGLRFDDRTVPGRSIRDAFGLTLRYLEPVSSWLVPRVHLSEIGWWRPARDLYRSPTQDLALRLWRRRGEPSLSDRVTVLKFHKTRIRAASGRRIGYADPGHQQQRLEPFLLRAARDRGAAPFPWPPGPEVAATDQRQMPLAADPFGAPRPALAMLQRLVGPRSASLYRRTGIDVADLVLRAFGVTRGRMLSRMLRRRTGEEGLPDTGLEEMLVFAERSGV
jgi:hypothetical protein